MQIDLIPSIDMEKFLSFARILHLPIMWHLCLFDFHSGFSESRLDSNTHLLRFRRCILTHDFSCRHDLEKLQSAAWSNAVATVS